MALRSRTRNRQFCQWEGDISETPPKYLEIPVGVVLRRRPGATRWTKWAYTPIAVLPGAPEAAWRLLREDGPIAEFHAATVPIELHRADVEAYRVSLTMEPPSLFVVLREAEAGSEHDVVVHQVTASAYEAQDYADGSEETVEPVPMPEGIVALIRDFVDAHFVDTPFVKRKRDKKRVDLTDDGIGDVRIRQTADVYRAPGQQKPGRRRLQ